MRNITAVLLLAALLPPLQASADTLQGRVVGVTDGDTLTLLDAAKAKRVGLWPDPNPVPPWDYRKEKRNGGE